MADDGYLIGYEDGSGNFIEVGRLNNDAQDVTKPLTLKHQDSGNSLSIDGSGADFGGQNINAGSVNTVRQLDPGDDIQTAIDAAQTAPGEANGAVRLNPSGDWTLPNAPYRIKDGVTLDARGTNAEPTGDPSRVWEFEAGAVFLGHGHVADVDGMTGSYFYTGDFSREVKASRNNRQGIYGYPTPEAGGSGSAVPLTIEQTAGAGISDFYAEVGLGFTQNGVVFRSTDDGGFVNHNRIHLRGRIDGGRLVSLEGSLSDDTDLHNNHVECEAVQIEGSVSHVFYCEVGRDNILRGDLADTGNATTFAEWTSGAGPRNQVTTKHTAPSNIINNSGDKTNAVTGLNTMGFEVIARDTTTVAAATTENEYFDEANLGDEIGVCIGFTDATDEPNVTYNVGWDHKSGSGPRGRVRFEETSGFADAKIKYTIYRISNS